MLWKSSKKLFGQPNLIFIWLVIQLLDQKPAFFSAALSPPPGSEQPEGQRRAWVCINPTEPGFALFLPSMLALGTSPVSGAEVGAADRRQAESTACLLWSSPSSLDGAPPDPPGRLTAAPARRGGCWDSTPGMRNSTVSLGCRCACRSGSSPQESPGLLPASLPPAPVLLLALLPACSAARDWRSFYSKGGQSAEFPNPRFFPLQFFSFSLLPK